MRLTGSRNLVLLVAAVWGSLFAFYGFLAYRARLWSPLWAIEPTTRAYAPTGPLSGPVEAPPAELGRALYRELQCGVCHGVLGEGGVKNPNADPEGVVPNLYDLADAFTRKDLQEKLLKGAQPARLEEEGPEPPLDMPAWRQTLSDDDLEGLTEYLLSLKGPADGAGGEK